MTDTDTRPVLERARAAMPGLAELDAALTAVQARQAAAGARAVPEADLIRAAAAEAAATCVVPGDMGQQVIATRRANEEIAAEIGALRHVGEWLEAAERDRHRDAADDGLAVLGEELDDIVDTGRAVLAALGPGVHDADSAIAHDLAGPWREARALAERHGELRLAQRIIVSAALSPPQQGRVADDVTPEAALLVDVLGTVQHADQHADVAAHVKVAALGPDVQRWTPGLISGQPVAVNQPPAPPWLDADPLAVLRFITRPDVQPSVPTIAELRAAKNEATRRKSPDNDEENQPVTSTEIAAAWRERGERSPRERGLIGRGYV